ncbi:MAG: hypothetical protein JWM09_1280 [Francisellaceae bacterium]|nr:hypothetical protein [Francisellaceae bacterium]
MRCVAYCVSTSFDTAKLFDYLKERYGAKRYREVLAIQLGKTDEVSDEGQVFFYPYGALVCWGLEIPQEKSLINEIRDFETNHIDICEDIFDYTYGSSASILEDEIILPNKETLTKVAFSHGLAQSVKLDFFEKTIQNTIHLTRELPEHMAAQGKISLSRKDIRKMMGRLFIDRNSINLHQELLDAPEFFWEYPDIEKYYALVAHYLDRERRVNVLNQRLNIVQELFDMLNSELNHQHSMALEWTIIILIMVEIIISLVAIFTN